MIQRAQIRGKMMMLRIGMSSERWTIEQRSSRRGAETVLWWRGRRRKGASVWTGAGARTIKGGRRKCWADVGRHIEVLVQLVDGRLHFGFAVLVVSRAGEGPGWAVFRPSGTTEHGQLLHRTVALLLGSGDGRLGSHLVKSVDEMTARSVGAESNAVIGLAEVGFVLWVSGDVANFLQSVSELTLLPVLAGSVFFVGPAHLRLVATGLAVGCTCCVSGGLEGWGGWGSLTLAASQHPGVASRAISVEARQWISQTGSKAETAAKWLRKLAAEAIDLNPQTLETVLLDLSNHDELNIK